MQGNARGRTRAAVLADAWCRNQVAEFESFLACVDPSARLSIEPLIADMLLVLDRGLSTIGGEALPLDAEITD